MRASIHTCPLFTGTNIDFYVDYLEIPLARGADGIRHLGADSSSFLIPGTTQAVLDVHGGGTPSPSQSTENPVENMTTESESLGRPSFREGASRVVSGETQGADEHSLSAELEDEDGNANDVHFGASTASLGVATTVTVRRYSNQRKSPLARVSLLAPMGGSFLLVWTN